MLQIVMSVAPHSNLSVTVQPYEDPCTDISADPSCECEAEVYLPAPHFTNQSRRKGCVDRLML